jgi:hypothetical protein
VTDGLDQALANAGLALLAADTQLTVFDGQVPDASPSQQPPYVVVYTTVGRPGDDLDRPLTGRSAVFEARWIVHAVGGNAQAARAVAQRVRTQLLDQVLVVPGLVCAPVRWEDSQPPQRDETTGVLLMDAVEIFRCKATS